ncbi:fungal-specific transcription factor domain-containing protein [Tricharina praecox]|uniref:fungal-specific transcription factor domain-containing protein n=1 Tax=Tricharina praecox TaxID=43433 RepID=UPI00221ECC96|nr:fungal-specific transcription factor domain-containing protein [Tricharina praecox]KAI5858162.1 fungal-specific transcription factor domain-containing protein [Tricharina praecox]
MPVQLTLLLAIPRPTCGNCTRFLIICRYADGKRESARKRTRELEAQVQIYENLLRELESTLDGPEKLAVQNALAAGPFTLVPPSEPTDFPSDDGSDLSMSDDEGSIGSNDTLADDINTLSVNKPTGYMGRGSEVSWLRSLRQALELDEAAEDEALREICARKGDPGSLTDAGLDMVGATYHLDDIDLSLSGDKYQIDTYHIPPKNIADELVRRYFDTVHPLVPIISKPEFEAAYEALHASGPTRIANHWLMIINLVFASGSRSGESVGIDMGCSHLECFNRARVLGALDGGTLFEIAVLKDVQALGLAGIYLLGSKQTNRAWNAVGLAIRLALGLGLHLRMLDSKLDEHQRQMRVRVWYSVEYLEATLSLVTGRPTVLQEVDLSQIPRSASIADSSPDAYYSALIKLSVIITVVQSQIYSTTAFGTVENKGKRALKEAIRVLRRRLDHWKWELPPILNFSTPCEDQGLITQRADLALRYYNSMILVYFNSMSRRYSKRDAAECVAAARAMLSLILHHTDNKTAGVLPWWCLLHYLVCAEAVLLHEIVRNNDLDFCQQLVEEARRPLEWLNVVGSVDLAAQRVDTQLGRLLGHVEAKLESKRGLQAAGLVGQQQWPSFPIPPQGM